MRSPEPRYIDLLNRTDLTFALLDSTRDWRQRAVHEIVLRDSDHVHACTAYQIRLPLEIIRDYEPGANEGDLPARCVWHVAARCGPRVIRTVVLVDLPAFGRPVRLRWRKRRWTCPNPDCALRSFIEQDPKIGPQRALLTSRAARWVTVGVGGRGRSVDEVAAELGCGGIR